MKVTEQDIDIAHRLRNRNKKPAAIVCKFTRRIAKEAVMSKRNGIRDIELHNVVVCSDDSDGWTLAIFDHLTPKKQELLKQAKSVQRDLGYTFCWVKNNILMRESQHSTRVIKIRSQADLDRFNGPASDTSTRLLPSAGSSFYRGSGDRGRVGYATRSRSKPYPFNYS